MTASADVQSRDFLHRHVETPLHGQYIAAGALCNLATNAECLHEAARQAFIRVENETPQDHEAFSFRLWVDERDESQPPWPKPYLRGLGNLVYVGLDRKSSVLVDLTQRRIVGRVSAGMASDIQYWRSTIFPMLMTVIAGSVGLVELHASCVEKGSSGLLLLGPGRSGKSTLAKALFNAGFRVLSDDRVFCSIHDGSLRVYGLPRPIKLRNDAGVWFDEYRDLSPTHVQNGEPVFHFNPSSTNSMPCEPKVIVCLERAGNGFNISRVNRSEIRRRIKSDLLFETGGVIQRQTKIVDHLADLPCWLLRYGARPEILAAYLAKLMPSGALAAAN